MTDNTPDIDWYRLAWAMETVDDEDERLGVVGRGRKIDRIKAAYEQSPAGAGKHQREEPHHYDIVCRTCGQPGTLRVSVDPNYPDPDLIAKIEGEFH